MMPAPASRPPVRQRMPHRRPAANLRRQYRLTLEFGLIVALGVLVFAFRTPLRPTGDFVAPVVEQERVQMEEMKQTLQPDVPPPPPRPRVPIAVSDETVLENDVLDLDASLNLDEPVATLPLPPPPPEPPGRETEPAEPEPEIFVVVEQMPELIGGIASIQQQLRYPELAVRAGVEGRVFVQFIVDENGVPTNATVIRGIGAGCDEEAVRAVLQARFKPGRQRGRAVRVKYVLPIVFKLKSR